MCVSLSFLRSCVGRKSHAGWTAWPTLAPAFLSCKAASPRNGWPLPLCRLISTLAFIRMSRETRQMRNRHRLLQLPQPQGLREPAGTQGSELRPWKRPSNLSPYPTGCSSIFSCSCSIFFPKNPWSILSRTSWNPCLFFKGLLLLKATFRIVSIRVLRLNLWSWHSPYCENEAKSTMISGIWHSSPERKPYWGTDASSGTLLILYLQSHMQKAFSPIPPKLYLL